VPGVLLIDWALSALRDARPALAFPTELGAVKFLQPVAPGAQLRIVFTLAATAAGAGSQKATLRIESDADVVATATLVFSTATEAAPAGGQSSTTGRRQ
jgi:3-hydroxymyristoyl/3-hydroxydecanoyl-(acyl carrier protein) dehydratase